MPHQPFFPDMIFGWAYFSILVALLAFAAVIDLRTAKIPKPLTLTIAALGILANIARGSWLGHEDKNTWELGPGSAWLGALDGFLFAFVGLLFAFIVFFGMWMLGVCGGGDVKLCAAIGAWIGAVYIIFLVLASVLALAVWIAGKIMLGGSLGQMRKSQQALKGKRKTKQAPETGPKRVTFSLPAAVAAALVMLWAFRIDLGLIVPPAAPEQEVKDATAPSTNR